MEMRLRRCWRRLRGVLSFLCGLGVGSVLVVRGGSRGCEGRLVRSMGTIEKVGDG
jgi:hypothetical protein